MTDGEAAVFLNMLGENVALRLGDRYTFRLKYFGSTTYMIITNVKGDEIGVDLRPGDELGVYVRGRRGYEHMRDLRDPTFDPVEFVVSYVREKTT